MRKILLLQRYAILTLLGLITIFAVPLSLSILFESEQNPGKRLRQPASIASNQPAGSLFTDKDKDDSQKSYATDATWPLPVKDIHCGQAQDLGATDSDMLRLKATDCDGYSPVRFTNTTNGYASDAISTTTNEYTSDYVDLKIGSNKIEVVRSHSDGTKTTQVVTVERRLREASAESDD